MDESYLSSLTVSHYYSVFFPPFLYTLSLTPTTTLPWRFFLPRCSFILKTGNTKLPETAQFTQAPQSTTAFKLSSPLQLSQPAGGRGPFSALPTLLLLLFITSSTSCSPPPRLLIVAVGLVGWVFTQGYVASCMYVLYVCGT